MKYSFINSRVWLILIAALLISGFPHHSAFWGLDSFPWNFLFSTDPQPRRSVPDQAIMEEYLESQVGLKRFGCRILNRQMLPFDTTNSGGLYRSSSSKNTKQDLTPITDNRASFYATKDDFDKCSKADTRMLYSTLYYSDPDEFKPSQCEVTSRDAKKLFSCLEETCSDLAIYKMKEFEVISKFFKHYFGHCSLELMPWSESFYVRDESIDNASLNEQDQFHRNEALESLAVCRKSDLIFLYNAILSHSFEEAKLIARTNRNLECQYSPPARQMIACIESTAHQFSRLHNYLDEDAHHSQCDTSWLVNQSLLRTTRILASSSDEDKTNRVVIEEAKAYNELLKSLMMNELDEFIESYADRLKDKSMQILMCLQRQPINPFIVRLLRFSDVKQNQLAQSLWVSILNRKSVFIVLCSCTALILLVLMILIMIPLVKVGRKKERYCWSEIISDKNKNSTML